MSIKNQSEMAHEEPDPDDLERRLEVAKSTKERVAILSPLIEELPDNLRRAAAYDQAETGPVWLPE